MTSQQENKQRAIDLLESRYRGMENVCEAIDMRLRMYFEDLLEHRLTEAGMRPIDKWYSNYKQEG